MIRKIAGHVLDVGILVSLAAVVLAMAFRG